MGLAPTGIVASTAPDAASTAVTEFDNVLQTKTLPEVCGDAVLASPELESGKPVRSAIPITNTAA